MMLGFERPSATKFFTLQGVPVLRVSELTGWPAKDWSSTSFPGDHGMMLLIFTFYMLRYFGSEKPALIEVPAESWETYKAANQ